VVSIPSPNSAYLILPGNTLNAGNTYAFNLKAYTKEPSGYVAGVVNTTFIVIVPESPVLALISGGSKLQVPVVEGSSKLLAFDGVLSADPDNSSFPLTYLWTLFRENGTEVANIGYSRTSVTFQLPTSALSPNKTYSLQLNVTGAPSKKTGATRAGTDRVSLETVAMSAPLVSVFLTGSGRLKEKQNPGIRLALGSTVENHTSELVRYEWSETSSLVNLTNPATRRSSLTGPNLVIAANALAPGSTYEFALSVIDAIGARGRAYLTVTVNSPPSLGSCYGTPSSGYALSTSFSLECNGWSDDDTPLNYRFRAYQNLSNALRLQSLSEFQEAESYQTLLPLPPAGNANLTIVASVMDALAATTTTSFMLTVVKETSVNLTDTSAEASAVLSSGDTQTFSALVIGAASYLKETNDSVGQRKAVRASFLTSIDTLAASGSVEAASLVEAITEFTDPEEVPETTQSAAIGILSTVAASLNSSSSSLDEVSRTEAAESTAGALSNVISASTATGSTSDSAKVNKSKQIESIISLLSSAQLQDAVEGEDATEITANGLAITSQLQASGSIEDSELSTSLGGQVKIGSGLGLPTASSVSTMITYFNDALYPVVNETLATGLLSVELRQSGQVLDVSASGSPFVLTIPLGGLTEGQLALRNYTCRYWNPTLEDWRIDGLSLVNTSASGGLTCHSEHLTSFNGDSELTTEVEINVNIPTKFDEQAFSFSNPMMVFCTAVFVFYLVVVVYAACKDCRITRSEGEEASESFWRQSNRARLVRISGKRNWHNFFLMTAWGFRRTHPWFAIFFRHRGDYISSVKRATILVTLLFNTMAVVALLMDQEQNLFGMNTELANSIVAMAFCFPVPFLITMLHKRQVPPRFKLRVVGDEHTSSLFGWALLCFSLVCGELMVEDIAGGGDEEEDLGNLDNLESAEDLDQEQVDGVDVKDCNADGEEAISAPERAAAAVGIVTAGATIGAIAGTAAGEGAVQSAQRRKVLEKKRRLREKELQLRKLNQVIELQNARSMNPAADTKGGARNTALGVIGAEKDHFGGLEASEYDNPIGRRDQKNSGSHSIRCEAGTNPGEHKASEGMGRGHAPLTIGESPRMRASTVVGVDNMSPVSGEATLRLGPLLPNEHSDLVLNSPQSNDRRLSGERMFSATSTRVTTQSSFGARGQKEGGVGKWLGDVNPSSLVRIRNEIKREMASIENLAISVSKLETAGARSWETRCLCCTIVSSSDPDINTHFWTWYDVIAITFELIVVFGCWMLLALLSNEMGDEMGNWSYTSLLSFAQDITFRVFQILCLEIISFLPCCLACGTAAVAGLIAFSKMGAKTHVAKFRPGILGFEFRKCRVVDVLPSSQAEREGVKLGMVITSISDLNITTDEEFVKYLKIVRLTEDEFAITFREQEIERSPNNIGAEGARVEVGAGPVNPNTSPAVGGHQGDNEIHREEFRSMQTATKSPNEADALRRFDFQAMLGDAVTEGKDQRGRRRSIINTRHFLTNVKPKKGGQVV